MATLLLYCYAGGGVVAGDRDATFDDVGARVICGGPAPGSFHSRGSSSPALRGGLRLLPESVKACAREGLVSLEGGRGGRHPKLSETPAAWGLL